MKIFQVNQRNINIAVQMLKQGKVIAHPTDTCYGLAASIKNKKAVEKIYKIKKMDSRKPVSIAVSSFKEIGKYGKLTPFALKLCKKYLPGKLTIILERKKGVPDYFNKETNTIGIRFLKHKLTMDLIKKLESPITTTSANLTGHPEAYSAEEVFEQFKNKRFKPDIIFENKKIKKKSKPSTIIQIYGNKIEVIRQGEVKISSTKF